MEPITHFNRSKWAIISMTPAQIPIVAPWIVALAPGRHLNLKQIIAQMQGEMHLASESNFSECFIGYLDKEPIFCMNGFPTQKIDRHSDNKGKDYDLTLLLNILLEDYRELYMPAWYEVLKFLFDRDNIDRVLFELDELDLIQKGALLRFGFKPMDKSEAPHSKHQYYACHKEDFLRHCAQH